MTVRSGDIERLLRKSTRAELAQARTTLVGVVESYDAATATADVRPVARRRVANPDGGVTFVREPVIPACPVVFPGSETVDITWDLDAGQYVLLHCAERSTDEWQATREPDVTPTFDRRFDLSDAFATPLNVGTTRKRRGSPGNGSLRIQSGGTTIVIDSNGNVQIKAASSVDVTSGGVPLSVAIAAQVEAQIDAFKTAFNAHTHIITAPGTPSGPAVPLAPPTMPTGSSTLRAD